MKGGKEGTNIIYLFQCIRKCLIALSANKFNSCLVVIQVSALSICLFFDDLLHPLQCRSGHSGIFVRTFTEGQRIQLV